MLQDGSCISFALGGEPAENAAGCGTPVSLLSNTCYDCEVVNHVSASMYHNKTSTILFDSSSSSVPSSSFLLASCYSFPSSYSSSSFSSLPSAPWCLFEHSCNFGASPDFIDGSEKSDEAAGRRDRFVFSTQNVNSEASPGHVSAKYNRSSQHGVAKRRQIVRNASGNSINNGSDDAGNSDDDSSSEDSSSFHSSALLRSSPSRRTSQSLTTPHVSQGSRDNVSSDNGFCNTTGVNNCINGLKNVLCTLGKKEGKADQTQNDASPDYSTFAQHSSCSSKCASFCFSGDNTNAEPCSCGLELSSSSSCASSASCPTSFPPRNASSSLSLSGFSSSVGSVGFSQCASPSSLCCSSSPLLPSSASSLSSSSSFANNSSVPSSFTSCSVFPPGRTSTKREFSETYNIEEKKRKLLWELSKRQKFYALLHPSCSSASPPPREAPCSPISASSSPRLSPSSTPAGLLSSSLVGNSSSSKVSSPPASLLPPLTYRHRLTYLFLQDLTTRKLLLGTSNFLVIVADQIKLSVTTICTALVYLHRFYEHFKFEGTERKYVAAACILLAWKYREDTESIRCLRKLFELSRSVYRVLSGRFADKGEKEGKESEQNDDESGKLRHHHLHPHCRSYTEKTAEQGQVCGSLKEEEDRRKSTENEITVKNESLLDNSRSRDATPTLSSSSSYPYHKSEGIKKEEKEGETKRSESHMKEENAVEKQEGKRKEENEERGKPASSHEDTSNQKDRKTKQSEASQLRSQMSVSKWIIHDGGAEFNIVKERIKLYEAALLRAIEYNIGPINMPFSLLAAYSRKLTMCFCEKVNGKTKNEFSRMTQNRAVLLLLDCYRSPFCLEYSEKEMTIACVWRAAVLLNVPFLQTYTFDHARNTPLVSSNVTENADNENGACGRHADSDAVGYCANDAKNEAKDPLHIGKNVQLSNGIEERNALGNDHPEVNTSNEGTSNDRRALHPSGRLTSHNNGNHHYSHADGACDASEAKMPNSLQTTKEKDAQNTQTLNIFDDYERRINRWLQTLMLKEPVNVSRIRSLLGLMRCTYLWMNEDSDNDDSDSEDDTEEEEEKEEEEEERGCKKNGVNNNDRNKDKDAWDE